MSVGACLASVSVWPGTGGGAQWTGWARAAGRQGPRGTPHDAE